LNEDADVQRLKQRRQNLMYQVAVLQLQRVREGSSTAPIQHRISTALRLNYNTEHSLSLTKDAGKNGSYASNTVMH
jgi:hypothetical protein